MSAPALSSFVCDGRKSNGLTGVLVHEKEIQHEKRVSWDRAHNVNADANANADKDSDDGDEKHWFCAACSRQFGKHGAFVRHHATDHPNELCCQQCECGFKSKSNLYAHLSSARHKPRRVSCANGGCLGRFLTEADLVLHYESGFCASGIARDDVDAVVRCFDRGRGGKIVDGDVYVCKRMHGGGGRRFFGKFSALLQHVEHGGCGAKEKKRFRKLLGGFVRAVSSTV